MNEWPATKIEMRPIDSLIAYASVDSYNAAAIASTKEYISKHGFNQPIVVSEDNIVVAGFGSYFAALDLCIDAVPVKLYSSLSNNESGSKESAITDFITIGDQ